LCYANFRTAVRVFFFFLHLRHNKNTINFVPPVVENIRNKMSITDIVPPGVVTGDDLIKLLEHARDNSYAIRKFVVKIFERILVMCSFFTLSFTEFELTSLHTFLIFS
jgi:hypothetical protein